MIKHIYNFSDFINERLETVKRKYTETYPAKNISTYAPVREKILSFVKENSGVTHEELMEFISSMNEEIGSITTRKWLNNNTEYFKISKTKEGLKTYTLSSTGEKVHKKMQEINNA
jgi:hypothetical protein